MCNILRMSEMCKAIYFPLEEEHKISVLFIPPPLSSKAGHIALHMGGDKYLFLQMLFHFLLLMSNIQQRIHAFLQYTIKTFDEVN